jgi:cobyrinic acid a,c-diamide synthase
LQGKRFTYPELQHWSRLASVLRKVAEELGPGSEAYRNISHVAGLQDVSSTHITSSSSSSRERPTLCLDGFLMGKEVSLQTYHTYSQDADLSIVEGCLGLFDSISTDGSEQGSTAQIAKWLQLPVLLVVDCQAFSTARGVAALLQGYLKFDEELHLAGVLLNKAAGAAHIAELAEGLQQAGIKLPVLGGLPKVRRECSCMAWLALLLK